MITVDRLPLRKEANPWVLLSENPPESLFPRFIEQMLPLLKTVALSNQLLYEDFKANPSSKIIFTGLKTSLNEVEKLMETYRILAQLHRGNVQVRLTEETPALIIEELNGLRERRVRITSQDRPGLFFKADHALLIKALICLLDNFRIETDSIEFELTSTDQTVTFTLNNHFGHSKEWIKTIDARFYFAALEAMHAKTDLSEDFISITFIRVNHE